MIRQTCYLSQCECLLESSQKSIYLLDWFHRMVLVRPKCYSESKLDLGFCSTQFLPSWPAGRSCFDMAVPALFIRTCLYLPGQSPIYLWKFSEGESHAMSMIKRSADHFHPLFMPLTSLHTCPDLPDQSPIYSWKQEDNDFHATFLIKGSADHSHLLFMLWLTRPILPDQSPIYLW